MRPLAELSHYDVLEIARDADRDGVERAYRIARAVWTEGSLAGYSLYPDAELASVRERVETAYRVLADADARLAYDAQLDAGEDGADSDPSIAFALDDARPPGAPPPPTLPDFATFEDEDVPWDGARLRRARLQRGVDIEPIAETTKVSASYLRFIEEDRFEALPADVYVRGFVIAYARCLGIDAPRAAADYIERLREARTVEPRRARGQAR